MVFLAAVTPGNDGLVRSSNIEKTHLGLGAGRKYPLPLLKLLTRYAENLIWSNDIPKSRAVLLFILDLTAFRDDALDLRKG